MAWQDDMNALDSDVAAGRITAEEYHTKRDELLAGSGSGSAAGGANPFPPPFRWGEQPQGGPQDPGAADRTQVVRAGTPAQDSDRTQVVRQGTAPDSDRTQVVNPDSDRTQVVRPGAPGPAQEQAPGSPPWQASRAPAGPPPPSRPGGTAPPWNTGEGFTPRQGPDSSFDDVRAKPRGSKWLVPVVAVVVAIVAIGAITVYALNGSQDNAGGGTTTTTAPAGSSSPESSSATPTTEAPAGLLATPAGSPVLDTTVPAAELAGAGVQSEADVAVLTQDDVTEVQGIVTDDVGLRRGVWAFRVDTAASATSMLTDLTQLYATNGYAPLPALPAGVQGGSTTVQTDTGPITSFRVHYRVDGAVVRVEAYGADPATVQAAFDALLQQQLDADPPA